MLWVVESESRHAIFCGRKLSHTKSDTTTCCHKSDLLVVCIFYVFPKVTYDLLQSQKDDAMWGLCFFRGDQIGVNDTISLQLFFFTVHWLE